MFRRSFCNRSPSTRATSTRRSSKTAITLARKSTARTEMAMDAPLLEMRDISKHFPGVLALDHVSFDLRGGEIHALVGENGAGKSTLMNVLGGVFSHRAYSGEVRVDGAARQFEDVRDAEEAGIAVVHQELSLVRELSIAENIFLGREPNRFGMIQSEDLVSRAQQLIEELHLS